MNKEYFNQIIDKANYVSNLLHSGKTVQCYFALQGLLTMLENFKNMESTDVYKTQQPKE